MGWGCALVSVSIWMGVYLVECAWESVQVDVYVLGECLGECVCLSMSFAERLCLGE